MVRDVEAYGFVQSVLAELEDRIPEATRLRLTGSPHLWRVVSANENSNPLDGYVRMYMPLGGPGTWIPFLPRKLKIKLAAIDVVEGIQSLIHDLGDRDWPFTGATVRARVDRRYIHVWFETLEKEKLIELKPLSVELLSSRARRDR